VLQVGQLAQVVLPSAQHFIPQDAFAAESFLQQVDEQPLIMTTAQASATNVTIDFIFDLVRCLA
jgi:hypothetical protein